LSEWREKPSSYGGHDAVRVRLYPTATQAVLLARAFGWNQFVWNMMFEE
jgi:hypothetical protein